MPLPLKRESSGAEARWLVALISELKSLCDNRRRLPSTATAALILRVTVRRRKLCPNRKHEYTQGLKLRPPKGVCIFWEAESPGGKHVSHLVRDDIHFVGME